MIKITIQNNKIVKINITKKSIQQENKIRFTGIGLGWVIKYNDLNLFLGFSYYD